MSATFFQPPNLSQMLGAAATPAAVLPPKAEAAVRAAFQLPGWVLQRIGSVSPVGIHVRRGDYRSKPDCHPVLPWEYYAHARQALGDHSGDGKYHVVSDDIGWCREWMPYASTYGSGDPADDFLSLAACRRILCANSTFSWWAAWLGRAERVTLPSPWFGPALPHDTRDLLPPGWQWVAWTPKPAKEPA